MRRHVKKMVASLRTIYARRSPVSPHRRARLQVEPLEERALLSGNPIPYGIFLDA